MSYASTSYPGNVDASSSSSTVADARRHSSIVRSMVSSSSPLPGSIQEAPRELNNPMPQLSLDQIFQQTRQFYHNIEKCHEEERKTWDKEREGWQRERKKLMERVDQLESTVADLIRIQSGSVTSPGDVLTQLSSSNILNATSHIPQDPASRAIWQGPESMPTRTFSDSAVPVVSRQMDQLKSIAEHPEPAERKKSVGFSLNEPTGITRHTSLAGVPGELIHPNYSGITLRSAALPPEIRALAQEGAIAVSPGRSPSPHTILSPAKPAPPPVIRPKLLDIPTANMQSEDLYSRDAGHTPLARVLGEEGTTGSMTPVTAKAETSLEPYPSRAPVRPPNERHDSYFANVKVDEKDELDADPALKEPLGVSSENTGSDTTFLDKVNEALEKKLSTHSDESHLLSAESKSPEKGHNRGLSESDEFPKLRMKSSHNFGAPFGESGPQ